MHSVHIKVVAGRLKSQKGQGEEISSSSDLSGFLKVGVRGLGVRVLGVFVLEWWGDVGC